MNQNQLRDDPAPRSVDQQQACSDLRCPKCGGENVMGKVSAFWAMLGQDGEPLEPLHKLVESCAELTDCRACDDCSHEWRDGGE